MPVPQGYNDTEARAVLHRMILPRVAEFRPEALVLQCGADSLTEDPRRASACRTAPISMPSRRSARWPRAFWCGRRWLQPLVGGALLDRDLGPLVGARDARPSAARGARGAAPRCPGTAAPARRPRRAAETLLDAPAKAR